MESLFDDLEKVIKIINQDKQEEVATPREKVTATAPVQIIAAPEEVVEKINQNKQEKVAALTEEVATVAAEEVTPVSIEATKSQSKLTNGEKKKLPKVKKKKHKNRNKQ